MKIGSGRLKWSKLPTPPDTPNSNNSNNGNNSPNTSKVGTASSKSSPHLVAVDNYTQLGGSGGGSSPTLASISASQSKSSSSLLQKQKWADGSLVGESGSNDIYELLAEQKLTDEYIWGGHPQLFPILFQYKDKIQQQNSNTAGHVLSIILPDISEFGDVKKRTYKIGKKLTVQQTVNLICKKQQVKDPRRFWLSTLMGCILNDDLLLSYYGFGTFFRFMGT